MAIKHYVIMFITVVVLFQGCGGDEDNNDYPTTGDSQAESDMATIVAVGDSLTAGYGLQESQAYPFLLEQKLQQDGYRYRVVNAGVSAETSSGTLSRIEWILTLDPDVVILETGANDGLRGIDPGLVEENIRKILQELERKEVTVILVGMKMVRNLGPLYVRRFNSLYPKLAKEFDVEFMPFFLKGVAMRKELNIADGIHPNEEGYRVIIENLYPMVVKVLNKR